MKNNTTKAGYVALIGKPNVGKSTLMNHCLGKKISITSSKPQTTRQRMLGIKTVGDTQLIFVDTPGIHTGFKRELNRYMNRVAKAALHDVDIVLFMVDATHWDDEDAHVVSLLKQVSMPVILVINKIDKIKDKQALLPMIQTLSEKMPFAGVVPISAKNKQKVDELESLLQSTVPDGMHYFPPEQFTDRSDRFIVAELIREKLTRQLGQELPYQLTVTLEALEEDDKVVKIAALIWIEKESHKSIVIGKGGERLKKVGTFARQDIERFFDKKVFLKLWVKIKSGWSDSASLLGEMGFSDE